MSRGCDSDRAARTAVALAWVGVLVVACGNDPTFNPDAGDGGAFPKECVSSGGTRVCGGERRCPADRACGGCVWLQGKVDYVGLCDLFELRGTCLALGGGTLDTCVDLWTDGGPVPPWPMAPWSVGKVLYDNGAAGFVRYSDFSLFTGEPMPEPAACPGLENSSLCGGACAPCPNVNGEPGPCVGRSPLRPYGYCRRPSDVGCGAEVCQPGSRCFRWVVQPEAQALADSAGICMDFVRCAELLFTMPGAVKCDPVP